MWSQLLLVLALAAPTTGYHCPRVVGACRTAIVCSSNLGPDNTNTERESAPAVDVEPAADLTEVQAPRPSEPFSVGAYVKELQNILIGTEFGLQVAALTFFFVAFLAWSTVALGDDPFWQSPVLPP